MRRPHIREVMQLFVDPAWQGVWSRDRDFSLRATGAPVKLRAGEPGPTPVVICAADVQAIRAWFARERELKVGYGDITLALSMVIE